jgi:hypothetical protein
MRHFLLTIVISLVGVTAFTGCDQSIDGLDLDTDAQELQASPGIALQYVGAAGVVQKLSSLPLGMDQHIKAGPVDLPTIDFGVEIHSVWGAIDFGGIKAAEQGEETPESEFQHFAGEAAAEKCAQYPVPADGTVWEGSVQLTTQDAIDALKGYRTVVGNVLIQGDAKSLEGLECLESIEGELMLVCTSQEDLTGLEGLRRVHNLTIQGAWGLKSLKGLDSLLMVEGKIQIMGAQNLENLDALGGVRVVGDLTLTHLNSLKSVAGLKILSIIEGSLLVRYVKKLEVLSLANLNHVGKNLTVRHNASLNDLQLPSLVYVGSNFTVNSNKQLSQCRVDALVEQINAGDGVGGKLTSEPNNPTATCE